MKRMRRRRWLGATAVALFCLLILALWEWQALARLAIVAGLEAVAHVRVAFAESRITAGEASFRGVRVTSLRGEPIAEIPRLRVDYDLRDLLPGGKRRFGLKAVDVESPRVTIIRRPDGTYNVPLPKLQANGVPSGPPLIARVRVSNGSVDVINESAAALPNQRHLYVRDLETEAEISTQRRSEYAASLRYGESQTRLYALRGAGIIDLPNRYIDQRWTASQLPIAGAIDFAANSPSFRVTAGTLQDVDLRYFGVSGAAGSLVGHLSGSATLTGGRILIAGLSQPIADVRGPVDVYDDGLMTPRLDAVVGNVPAKVSGGIYGLRSPRLRVAVRGTGELAQLRTAFAQARRLPINGALDFALLAEGHVAKPVIWIHLHSPRTTYAATAVDNLNGVLAYDGSEVDVLRIRGGYGGVAIAAGGRIGLHPERNAVEMLVGVNAPPGGTPYVNQLLPQLPLNGIALASADDPKAMGVRGVLWGGSAGARLGGIFNVDNRGVGSLGPLEVASGNGSLYARIALDQPHRADYGIVEVSNFPIARANGSLTAAFFGGGSTTSAAVKGVAQLVGSWGNAGAQGTVALQNGALRGSIFGTMGRFADFGTTLGGTARNPHAAGTVVVAGGRYRDFEINGNAGFAYERNRLTVHDAAVAIGPLFLGLAGTVSDLAPRGSFSPSYDLAAQLHSSDVSALLATVQPRAVNLVQGSIDADLVVRGTAMQPTFAGTIQGPEGSVNGLAFRDLRGHISGNAGALQLTGGHVVVGSSPIALSAAAAPGREDVSVDAPRLDLADFNDFFDTGDTFAGVGSLALRATLEGTQIVATTGRANFSDARFRRIALGSVAAHWDGGGDSIASSLQFGGLNGQVAISGSVAPAARRVNLIGSARAVDLATWLPMLGLNAPITGRLDAETSISGTYPDIAMWLHAALYGGTAGRLPIERFEVVASASGGRGRIDSAVLTVPSLTTTASGTFGLHPGDPIALTFESTSPNIGDFLERASGKTFGLSAGFASNLRIEGTRDRPHLRDTVSLQTLRYRNFTIPRVAGEIDADRHSVALRNGEIDLERGRALLTAALPIELGSWGVKPGDGAIAGSLLAQDVELSSFAALLPKGTQLTGRIDGAVRASGTRHAPNVSGNLTLRDGTFNGPIEKSPITGIEGALDFSGSQARLQSHAFVGGGAVTASAVASLADLSRPASVTFTAEARADHARFDLPSYFQGNLNGAVTIARRDSGTPTVGGDLSIYNARIPLTAFLSQKSAKGAPPPFNVAFENFRIAAGENVRVQSANVDVGATGAVRLGGSLAAPTLAGEFHSTGGSLSFYRSFNLERGIVSFDPGAGLIPDVNAVATTFVPNPATAVRLHVTGPVTDMNLDLASDPPYSKQQILGLLVGAQQFGAVQGVQSTGGGSFSAGSVAQNVALGQLNTLFTRNLLEPLNASLGSALGFTEVQITSDIQTGLGVNAVKAFGKYVNAIWSQSFGYPKTQAIALEAHPNISTGLRLTAYSSEGPTLFAVQNQPQPIGMGVLNLNPLTSFTPISGQNGVSFVYQRKFP